MTYKELRRMTYRELEKKLAENRVILDTTKNIVEKRRIIIEDHEIMTEMDRRWQAVQK